MSRVKLRNFRLQKSFLSHAEGSCLVTMGKTQVLCVASVEDAVPKHAEEKGTGWITAEYAMLPRAGESRSPRSKVNSGGRVQEISRLVGRSLRSAVDLSLLGPRTLTIDCDVIRADGGTRTASINGGFVALVQALMHLRHRGLLPQWPLKNFVGAVSVGLYKGKPVLDLAYEEDKDADSDMNVVMTGRGQFIEVQGTAEGSPFSKRELDTLLNLAQRGIRSIHLAQKKVLGPLPVPSKK